MCLSNQDKEVREALEVFSSALEAAVVQLRQNLGLQTKAAPGMPAFDLTKISWREAKGDAGPFDLATDEMNKDNQVYMALKNHLQHFTGKATISGKFVWLFDTGKAIGAKPQKGKGA